MCRYLCTTVTSAVAAAIAAMFQAILRTFLSLKVLAFCRLVISARRGCLQFPGVSGAGDGAALVGVDTVFCNVEDILMCF